MRVGVSLPVRQRLFKALAEARAGGCAGRIVHRVAYHCCGGQKESSCRGEMDGCLGFLREKRVRWRRVDCYLEVVGVGHQIYSLTLTRYLGLF
jgi:hypothetical protein